MSGGNQRRPPNGSGRDAAGDPFPETASLTAELMTRGRRRAREIVGPVLAESSRSSAGLRALASAVSRRDVALVAVWAAIFAGCFLLVRLTG